MSVRSIKYGSLGPVTRRGFSKDSRFKTYPKYFKQDIRGGDEVTKELIKKLYRVSLFNGCIF